MKAQNKADGSIATPRPGLWASRQLLLTHPGPALPQACRLDTTGEQVQVCRGAPRSMGWGQGVSGIPFPLLCSGLCPSNPYILSPCYQVLRRGKMIDLYLFFAKAQSLSPYTLKFLAEYHRSVKNNECRIGPLGQKMSPI